MFVFPQFLSRRWKDESFNAAFYSSLLSFELTEISEIPSCFFSATYSFYLSFVVLSLRCSEAFRDFFAL